MIVSALAITVGAAYESWYAYDRTATFFGWPAHHSWVVMPLVELFLVLGSAELALRHLELAATWWPRLMSYTALVASLAVNIGFHLLTLLMPTNVDGSLIPGAELRSGIHWWQMSALSVFASLVPLAQLAALHTVASRLQHIAARRTARHSAPAAATPSVLGLLRTAAVNRLATVAQNTAPATAPATAPVAPPRPGAEAAPAEAPRLPRPAPVAPPRPGADVAPPRPAELPRPGADVAPARLPRPAPAAPVALTELPRPLTEIIARPAPVAPVAAPAALAAPAAPAAPAVELEKPAAPAVEPAAPAVEAEKPVEKPVDDDGAVPIGRGADQIRDALTLIAASDLASAATSWADLRAQLGDKGNTAVTVRKLISETGMGRRRIEKALEHTDLLTWPAGSSTSRKEASA